MPTKPERIAWLKSMAPYAIEAKECWPGMRVSCCLAQAALETAWGARPIGWNLWGIKDVSWHPGAVDAKTHEIINGHSVGQTAAFERCDTPEEGFAVYGRLVTNSRYYQDAREAPDLEQYIRCLARHWATDPGYAGKILEIVREYELAQYDVEASDARTPGVVPPTADPGFVF